MRDSEATGGIFAGWNLYWGQGRQLGHLRRANENYYSPTVLVQQSQECMKASTLCGQQTPSCTLLTFHLWWLGVEKPSVWDGLCSPKHLTPGSLSWCCPKLGAFGYVSLCMHVLSIQAFRVWDEEEGSSSNRGWPRLSAAQPSEARGLRNPHWDCWGWMSQCSWSCFPRASDSQQLMQNPPLQAPPKLVQRCNPKGRQV